MDFSWDMSELDFYGVLLSDMIDAEHGPRSRSGRRRKRGKVALVSGASGIQGRALIRQLTDNEEWVHIYAISRHTLEDVGSKKLEYITLDLMDKTAVQKTLRRQHIDNVTYVFHLAFHGDTTNFTNGPFIMMRNLVEGLEANGNRLRHVYFPQGIKKYDFHLGKDFPTPFREEDGKPFPPNYYIDLKNYAEERVKGGARWTWSSLIPNAIVGFAPRSWMSILQVIAVYGTLCKEMNIPMRFPGSFACYHHVMEVADANILADAAVWTATHKKAWNDEFNCSNGDTFRWAEVWPKIARDFFNMEDGPIQQLPLQKIMTTEDKKQLWQKTVKKYNLHNIPYEDMVHWDFGDQMLNLSTDCYSDITKLRAAGYDGMNHRSKDDFVLSLHELADMKIIPNYPKHARKKAHRAEMRAEAHATSPRSPKTTKSPKRHRQPATPHAQPVEAQAAPTAANHRAHTDKNHVPWPEQDPVIG